MLWAAARDFLDNALDQTTQSNMDKQNQGQGKKHSYVFILMHTSLGPPCVAWKVVPDKIKTWNRNISTLLPSEETVARKSNIYHLQNKPFGSQDQNLQPNYKLQRLAIWSSQPFQ